MGADCHPLKANRYASEHMIAWLEQTALVTRTRPWDDTTVLLFLSTPPTGTRLEARRPALTSAAKSNKPCNFSLPGCPRPACPPASPVPARSRVFPASSRAAHEHGHGAPTAQDCHCKPLLASLHSYGQPVVWRRGCIFFDLVFPPVARFTTLPRRPRPRARWVSVSRSDCAIIPALTYPL